VGGSSVSCRNVSMWPSASRQENSFMW
jgi:hypothetical protein